MFTGFKTRITLTCLGVITLCYLIINVFCIRLIFSNVVSNYNTLLQTHLSSLCTEIQTQIDLVEQTTLLAAQNPTVIEALSTEKFNPTINDYLNGLQASMPTIQGISIYSAHSNYCLYTTLSVSNAPPLEFLEQRYNLYTHETKPLSWIVRYQDLFPYYDDFRYERTKGVLTYISPIYSIPNQTLGYLIIDLGLPKLLQPLQVDSNLFLSDLYVAINLIDENISIPSSALGFSPLSFENEYIYIYSLTSNAQLEVHASLDHVYAQFNNLKKIIFIIFIGILVLFLLLSQVIIRQVVVPIQKLASKLNRFIDTL
ncbi:hypothetical protein PBV87_14320 [Niameybacter massiliensis]|uniref:Uncharacterized protein n=1 Tax=Holtiella tumoricola TaxID=3018743 RepID=A0AA42J1R4_9FIRM|nr:hypothetical protein [Holtiella tumoricola]MDA3732665.1 hypothetical protein [Holtiella tumoricola]